MIQLDVTNTSPRVVGESHGIDLEKEQSAYQGQLKTIVDELWASSDDPACMTRWLRLGTNPELVSQLQQYADRVKGRFDQLVIVGIGGSALGALAMFEALLPSYWNDLTTEQRQGRPRYYFVDNVDPDKLQGLLSVLDLKRTLVNVITKSGTTAETMAGFLWLKAELEKAVGKDQLRDHLVMTTDPVKGLLRQIVEAEGYPVFDVPDGVGGRFSVFSAVGLLPAALLGIPVEEMLRGIQELVPRLQDADVSANLAAQGALIQYLYYRQGKTISVFMPYSAKLASVADWYVQLWAESLGKRVNTSGATVHEGPTPLKAVGVTDQHSQVQLFNEGPFDKIFTFIRVGRFNQDLTIPNLYPDSPDLNYLGNRSFAELLNAEADATRASLTKNQRPNVTLTLPQLDPHHFAQLLFLLEVQTAIMGRLLNVDPFDQPGVELGKQYTYALMGRPGYEHMKADVTASPSREALTSSFK